MRASAARVTSPSWVLAAGSTGGVVQARRAGAVLLIVAVVFLGTACAPKSPDHAEWTDEAHRALAAAQSEVETVRLMLRQQRDGKAWQNYQQVIALDSEEAAGRTAESFSSIQPPPGDDRQYRRVTTLLSDASDLVTDVRIAVVREDTASYSGLIRDLRRMSTDLNRGMTGLGSP
jgi:hypothetical protein